MWLLALVLSSFLPEAPLEPEFRRAIEAQVTADAVGDVEASFARIVERAPPPSTVAIDAFLSDIWRGDYAVRLCDELGTRLAPGNGVTSCRQIVSYRSMRLTARLLTPPPRPTSSGDAGAEQRARDEQRKLVTALSPATVEWLVQAYLRDQVRDGVLEALGERMESPLRARLEDAELGGPALVALAQLRSPTARAAACEQALLTLRLPGAGAGAALHVLERACEPARTAAVPDVLAAMSRLEDTTRVHQFVQAVRTITLADALEPRIKAFFAREDVPLRCPLLEAYLSQSRMKVSFDAKVQPNLPLLTDPDYGRYSDECLARGQRTAGVLAVVAHGNPERGAGTLLAILRAPTSGEDARHSAAIELRATQLLARVRANLEELALRGADARTRALALTSLSPVLAEPGGEAGRTVTREHSFVGDNLEAGGCFVLHRIDHPTRRRAAFVRRCPSNRSAPWLGAWSTQLGYVDFERQKIAYRERRFAAAFSLEVLEGSWSGGGFSEDGRYFWLNRWPFGDWSPPRGHSEDVSEVYATVPLRPVKYPRPFLIQSVERREITASVITALLVSTCTLRSFAELMSTPRRCLRESQLGRENCRVTAVVEGFERPRLLRAGPPDCTDVDAP